MSGDRAGRLAAVSCMALAAVLVLLTFLPWASWLGHVEESEALAYAGAVLGWLWWTAAILAAVALLVALTRERVDRVSERWRQKFLDLPGGWFAVAVAALAAVVESYLSQALLARNPHLVDEIAQLFQARIFLGGALSAPAPEHFEFFAGQHVVRHAGRWFSQYPPGHPALLAPGLWLGVPWLVNPLFAGATVLVVFATARRLLGEGSAKLAATLYFLAPFAVFMGASYMSHVTTGFFLALALYAAVRAAEPAAGAGWAVLTGLAIGGGLEIRPFESAAWAVALGLWILVRRGWKQAFLAGSAGLVAVVPLLVYNALTTGHALRFGYTLLWGPGHGLGFHTDPWGEPFTPLKSFAVTALDFQRLDAFLFAWPFPSLLFVVAALAVAALDERLRHRVLFLAALLFAGPIAYFFYWHRDDFLGPRFLFSSIVPAVLLTVVGISALDARLGRWRSALRLTLLAGALVAVAVNFPATAGVVAARLPGMKLHPEQEAKRAGISEALVFVKVGWGSRLIGRLWGWGVPAEETEQTYRAVDGCRLQLALDEADSLVAAGHDSAGVLSALRGQMAGFRALDLPVVHERWPERSVRYDTTVTLVQRCAREVARDAMGYTLFETLIWRMDPWLRDGVIYARDLGPAINRRLRALYPDRPHLFYTPLSGEPGSPPVFLPLPAEETPQVPVPAQSASAAEPGR